jgi:hypothetical protein
MRLDGMGEDRIPMPR